MMKSICVLIVLSAGALGFQERARERGVLPGRLQDARIVIESNATAGEALLSIAADSAAELVRFEVLDPRGELALALRVPRGVRHALQAPRSQVAPAVLGGFYMELVEPGLAELFAAYPAGTYVFRAWTESGELVSASAELAHELLPPPIVLQPNDGIWMGARTTPTVHWVPDRAARGYRVRLEQGEDEGDDDELSVELPAGSDSFRIPPGFLQPGKPTHLEVGVVSVSGNTTFREIVFRTPE
jgi:hypothetical protein